MSGFLAMQRQSGAYPSEVEGLSDETCFVTASIALLLDPIRHRTALQRALDFIERCECMERPGAFAFYPASGSTPRLIERLPPDADDTALAWLALLHGKRRTITAARTAFERVIAPASRNVVHSAALPWVRPHAVRTWLVDAGSDNPIDLTVNVNVVALAHCIGMPDQRACMGACNSLLAAARDMYEPRAFARRLAPYYADISELGLGVRRAMAYGASQLEPVMTWLAPVSGIEAFRCDKPLYCNDHGSPVWRSPVLQEARRTLGADFSHIHHSANRG